MGYHVQTYGGGQWGTVAWFGTKAEAEKERARMMMLGLWAGLPPRIIQD